MQQHRGIARRAAAGIVPHIGDHHRAFGRGHGLRYGGLFIQRGHQVAATIGEQFLPQLPSQLRTQFRRGIGHRQRFRAHFRDIACHEAVDGRQRQDARIGLFQRDHAVDKAAHRLARGGENVDHPAIVNRHDRARPAFQRVNRDTPHIFGPVDEIGMGEFLEDGKEIRRRDPFCGQVAVRIEFRAQQNIRPDDVADAGQQVAFGVQIALRHHRAVQAQHHRIHRHGGAQLVQNFVAQGFVSAA